jgi:hypothetical protein
MDMLPVYVHMSGKSVRAGWVRVRDKSTPVKFQLPSKPERVSLNDNDDILAEIKQ